MEQMRDRMQIDRQHDEVAFSHALDAGELKAHLERLIVPGDCSLCEWFGRAELPISA